MLRTNQIVLLVGKRKTGKTFFGRKLINSTPLNKILIVDTFEHPDYKDFETIGTDLLPRWKQGKKRILIKDDEQLEAINQSVKNTLIVFEDCTKYIGGDLSKPLKGIVFDSKQKNNDIIFMYHGFSFAPPKLLANVNYITLFKVGENIESYKTKIPNYEEINQGHKKIQASSDPFINKTFLVN